MAFPLLQHEWWFCQDPDCRKSDRVYGLQAQSLALAAPAIEGRPSQNAYAGRLGAERHLAALFRVGDATLASRIEELLMTGRLHLHKIEREIKWARHPFRFRIVNLVSRLHLRQFRFSELFFQRQPFRAGRGSGGCCSQWDTFCPE